MTEKGRIPWSVFDLERDEAARRVFVRDLQEYYQAEQRGVYGSCTCERPGYQRHNPTICRHCNKPHRKVTA